MNGQDECRAFVLHLLDDHRRLEGKMLRIKHAIDESGDEVTADTKESICHELVSLRKEMAHHFHQEESGGCIEEAVCRCPTLAAEATELEHEHESLLELLGKSIVLAEGEHDWRKFRATFADLTQQVLEHENKENDLIQRGFNTSFDLREQC